MKRFLWGFILPVCLWAGMIGWISPWGEFPLNDDWTYAKLAERFAGTGRYIPTGWEVVSAIPQTLLGGAWIRLMGFSHSGLRFFNILIYLGSAFIIYHFLSREKLAPFIVGVSVALFLFFPPVSLNALSFMSEGVFLLFWIAAVMAAIEALRNNRMGVLIIAGICLSCAVLQRPTAIVLVAPILLSMAQRRRSFRFKIVLSTLVAITVFLFGFWYSTLASKPLLFVTLRPLDTTAAHLLQHLLYIGLFVFPFLALINFRQQPARARWIAIGLALIAAQIILWGLVGRWMPYFGNTISEFGVFREWEVLGGDRDQWLSQTSRIFLTICAFSGLAGLLWNLIQRPLKEKLLLKTVVVLYLVILCIRNREQFDRYLIPIFPLVLAMIEWRSATGWLRRVATVGVICLFGFFTAVVSWNYFRWNEVRWQAGQYAVSLGATPSEVEGGYEWDGWYRTVTQSQFRPYRLYNAGAWEFIFTESDQRYKLSFSPLHRFRTVKTFQVSRLFSKATTIHILEPLS